MSKSRSQSLGILMLLITAFIWGTAFVAQSVGMESVECFTYSGLRTLLGALVLMPYILIRDYLKVRNMSVEEKIEKKRNDKDVIIKGSILGLIFFVAQNLQQYAFNYSTAGKIAFITALYMFFVPLLGLFLGKRISKITWTCIFLGFVGLYFLCLTPENITAINRGDVLAFLCAIAFAVHILVIERFASDTDGVKLSCMQFLVSGLVSCLLMFIFEHPTISAIKAASASILYAGIMSSGVAYTFQIIGQKHTEATIASMLMCLESVFAVLAGAVILKEFLNAREMIGCVLMFVAIIFSQIAETVSSKRVRSSEG